MTPLNRHAIAFALGIALCVPLGAQAQLPPPNANTLWTTVGSVGSVDETDTQNVFFDKAAVQIGRPRPGLATAGAAAPPPAAKSAATAAAGTALTQTRSAVIRYSIDGLFPVRERFPNSNGRQLMVRFLDTGGNARVLVRLMEVDLATGAETAVMTFDSDSSGFQPADHYQRADLRECDRTFDFVRKAYYIEATLTGGPVIIGTAAGIQVIQVGAIGCFG
jgi:hypothetical protein